MDLDALLHHFFGTAALDTLPPEQLSRGIEAMRIALGTEAQPGRRFALWATLHALNAAPEPACAFKNAAERKAAEDYARLTEPFGPATG